MKIIKYLFKNNEDLLLSVISIAFIIAIFVCILVDGILNSALTWSLYPVGSCIFAWLVLLPLIKLKKHKIIISACTFSLLLIPFLFLIEYACPVKDWVIPLGVPISAISIVFLGISLLLCIKSKLYIWYKVSLITLLAAPVTYFINTWTSNFLQESNSFSDVINTVSVVCLSLVFFFVGRASKKKGGHP